MRPISSILVLSQWKLSSRGSELQTRRNHLSTQWESSRQSCHPSADMAGRCSNELCMEDFLSILLTSYFKLHLPLVWALNLRNLNIRESLVMSLLTHLKKRNYLTKLYKSLYFISSLLYLGQRRFILFIQQSREHRYRRKNTCGHKFPERCWSVFLSPQETVLHLSRPGQRFCPPSAK